eukprot:358421-Chlamydomonas_euryale.AAC.5
MVFVVYAMDTTDLEHRIQVIVTLVLAVCALQFMYSFPPAEYLNAVQQVWPVAVLRVPPCAEGAPLRLPRCAEGALRCPTMLRVNHGCPQVLRVRPGAPMH